MITIIHGEDVAKSRNYFSREKAKYKEAISLQGSAVTLTEIMQVFEGDALFSTEKYIFIEDFFAKKKKSKETTEIVAVINNNHAESQVFFWESKDLTPAQLKQFPKATISQFKLPQTLFVFLDAVKPENGKVLIGLFHQALVDQDVQFLFVMLIRQFRLLLAVLAPGDNPIDEVKRMAPWQKGKLEKQAGLFGSDKLIVCYKSLFQIEYALKTGGLSMPLEEVIDFFLLEL